MQEGQPPNEPGWVFKPGDQSGNTASQVSPTEPALNPSPIQVNTEPRPAPQEDGSIEWTASEYLANPKNSGWYGLLAAGSISLAVIVWFMTGGDIASTVVICIVALVVGVFAARQPQTLTYRIDNRGLTIGEKFYPYEGFKSFSVANEHPIGYISLMPLKRFMPPLTIHYVPDDEDRISEVLSAYLPYEEHKPDMVDNFTRRLRF
jgi:hypothetical protein